MNTPILRLLNIKPSEAWLVRNLFFLQLFQSIGIAMLYALSYAVFLAKFNVEELPKVYIASALVLLAVNYIYTRLEHHIRIQHLILYILIVSAVSILIIQLMMYSVHYDYAPVVLLIWYQVIYLICGNSFWGLASQVFDVRESKRIFSILSSGDLPAKILGYLTVSAFIHVAGINNFLFFTVACFSISFLFMRHIIRSHKVDFNELAHKASHKETLQAIATPGPLDMIRSFFGNTLILLISLLSFIVVVSLTVIDFTFLSEVKLKYKDDVALAAFLGYFLAIGRVAALLAKITLTSRIEQQLGIKRSLLILPCLLLAFTIFILLSQQLVNNLTFYLYAFGTMVVMTEVLKSVLQDPLILVLFQPLKPVLRLKGHLISKGILAPLGLLFGGIFIYVNIQWTGGMHIATTCFLLLIMCAVWILVVHLLNSHYISSLIESLKKGFFRGNFLLANDDTVKSLLLEKLNSPKPLEVIYASDTLEKLDEKAFQGTLLKLLDHDHEDVKKFALKKASEKKLRQLIPKVTAMLNEPITDELRMVCVITLSDLHEDQTGVLLEYLDHPNPQLQKEAMVNLFTTGDINAIILAGKKLMEWMNADAEENRMLASEVIGKVADKNFYTSLAKLINDPSPAVEKRAIQAAGEIRNTKLIPLLFEKLKKPGVSKTAVLALSGYGEEVIMHFPVAEELMNSSKKTIQQYISIAVRVRGEKAKAFLEKLLFTDPSVKQEVIAALKETAYAAPAHLRDSLHNIIMNELDNAEAIISYLAVLFQEKKSGILRDALTTELRARETNIFYLLSFSYERQKFLQAFENIQSGRKENIANAIEIIDLGVSKKIRDRFIPVIEYLHLDQQLTKMETVTAETVLQQIKKIIANTPVALNSWTSAAAMYTMNLINPVESVAYLSTLETHGDYLIEETRNFVLAKQP